MKNLFKYIGIISIVLFSFYYTEKMNSIVINNSSLVMEINDNSKNYNIEPVNAIIEDNYIIPGLNGYAVNVLKSYDNMKFLDTFNSYYLEYDKIKPIVSLKDNKDKIIKYGNSGKKSISLIIKDNNSILDYIKTKNINITRLVNFNTFDKNFKYEQINNDFNNYKKLEKLLNNSNQNKNICYVTNQNYEICKNNNKFLVEASLVLNSYNLASIKDKIKSGNIIFINDNVSLTDFKLLVKEIYYQNLNIVSLSNLIKEERD